MTSENGERADLRKIAIFVADLDATGVVVNALAIAGELNRRGVSVELVTARATGTLQSAVPEGVSVTQLLPDRVRVSRRRRLRNSVAPLRRFLTNSAPAAVFSAGNQGNLTTVVAASGISGLRVVVRISNEPEQARSQSFLSRQLRRLKFRRIARAADRMVFVSGRLLKGWDAIGAGGGRKSLVVPNGVDVEAVRAKGAEPCSHPWFRGDVPVVLGVGRLVQQKNFATLIDALALASASHPLRLLLIGDGPLADSLTAQAAARGLQDSFAIIPPIPNPMPYMARAALVALPSWWEGASNVLLEALACGTPVIASRTAGSAEEVLSGGDFGILVDPADPRNIADALLKQVGPAPVLPGNRASQFSRQAALDAYADLLIEEAELAASAATRP